MEGLLILLGLVVGIGVPVGFIMGIAGFARGGRALRQVEALRREIAELRLALTQRAPQPAAAAVSPEAATPEAATPEAAPAQPPSTPVEEAPAEEAPAEEALPEWVRARVRVRGSVPATHPPEGAAPGPASAQPEPAPPRRRRDVEELLTLKLGVWLGGAALLFAGIFLVRYAVEQELLGPAARCALAALLGVALVAGAEFLRRGSAPLPVIAGLGPDQAPPALAAGGVAVLFGAAYGFGPFYGLVPEVVAFVLLAAAALSGLVLALRFGQLVAAIGIIGAFATPILVQTESPSVPGLYAYLLFVIACALAVVRIRAWVWLGWATAIAAAFWVLAGAGGVTQPDAWAPGLFVPAAAALNLFLLPRAALEWPIGRKLAWLPYAALGCAGLVLYLALPGWPVRIGELLLIPLAIAVGARERQLDRLPWLSVAFFLATLLFWALPAWNPGGEVVETQEMIQAVLPGAWAPDVIQPLLFTAILIAALYTAAGLWQERAAPRPLVWAALAGAVPPLTLAVTYAQVAQFQPRPLWAVFAAFLAAAQTAAAEAARREDFAWPRQRAGIHAAGAVATLSLGCAMVLEEQWLTLAIALQLPALAWIEAAADLPPLRKVAIAVALLVLARLLLNWYVIDYALGGWPVVNLLLVTYGVPAICFALAARLFRRRADDMAVAVLESGACAFATVLVMLEIRHWSHGGDLAKPGTGFLECALHVSSLGVLALVNMRLAARLGRKVLEWAWRIQGALALFGGILLILANPMIGDARVHGPPVFNDLLPAYLLPALLAGLALLQPPLRRFPGVVRLVSVYALVAVFAWITLEIRHLFHPGNMNIWLFGPGVEDAELWSWSGGWMAYGIALMVAGIRFRLRALRLGAIAVIGVTAFKVFVVDMSGLTGLWRVLSFLGLGLTLIGLGAVFRRYVAAGGNVEETAPPTTAPPTTAPPHEGTPLTPPP